MKILMVCLGNICRSPLAEEMTRVIAARDFPDLSLSVDSAGIGAWHTGQLPDKRMRVHAIRRGYSLTHHARQVRTSDFEDFDLIIGMDAQNVDDLRALAPSPEAMAKVRPMGDFLDPSMGFDHVPDPYYEGTEGFERVLDLLEDGIPRLLRSLA